MTPVIVRAPAKVNLQLAVGPRRADGYHELVTVFHAVSLFDEVAVRPADRTRVLVAGQDAGSVPRGHANLAARAAAALAKVVRPGRSAVQIEISKRIPMAAGLAGGSADAAAALVACNELWRAGLTQQELGQVAASVGSDVAFAIFGGTAIGRGRGEQLAAALVAGTYHWVLAFAAGGLATPEVFAACDRLRGAAAADTTGTAAPATAAGPAGSGAAGPAGSGAAGPAGSGAAGPGGAAGPAGSGAAGPGGAAGPAGSGAAGPAGSGAADPAGSGAAAPAGAAGPAGVRGADPAGVTAPQLDTALMAALRSGDPAAVGPLLANDLQPAAVSLRPELRRALAAGRELGALGAIVSGSGPTCAFLAADAGQAKELAVSLTGAGICRAVAVVSGPVPGAAIVTAERR